MTKVNVMHSRPRLTHNFITNTVRDIEILSLFSKFRTEMMGCAILGVLIIHYLFNACTGHEKGIIAFLCGLIYTPGFLFLSGFGLYYSYSKDSHILHFYKKRINRLYVPFCLISFIFLVLYVLRNEESIGDLFAYLTTIAFWYKGNYYGTWYVAVSLLLYFLYPFIHKFFFNRKNVLLRGIVFISAMFVCGGGSIWLLSRNLGNFWQMDCKDANIPIRDDSRILCK